MDLASTKVKKVPWHALKFLDGYCEAWELKITPTDANIVEIQTHLFNNIRSLSLHGGDLDLIPKLTNFTGMKKLDLRENRIENLTFKAYLKGQEEGDRTNICLASKN